MPTPSILKKKCGLPRLPSFLSKNAVYPDSLHSRLSSLWFPGSMLAFFLQEMSSGRVVHTCNPSIQKLEAGGPPQVPGQPGLPVETCLKNKQTKPNKLGWKPNVLEQSCFYCFSEHLDWVVGLPLCSWPCSGTQRLLSPLSQLSYHYIL